MVKTGEIIAAMTEYYSGDPKRINHFLKVYAFCKAIADKEAVNSDTQYILEVTAIVHDIGIKISEEKYGSSAGKYQEIEGPAQAEALLSALGVTQQIIDRVCFLVGHHHTYSAIDNIDYQILVEADFLVNAFEDGLSKDAITYMKKKLFKTKTGIKFINDLFGV